MSASSPARPTPSPRLPPPTAPQISSSATPATTPATPATRVGIVMTVSPVLLEPLLTAVPQAAVVLAIRVL